MLFTIVIPTLNEEHFLGGLLEDLATQDCPDFEVVHVDGKSEDKTCEIAQSYQSRLVLHTITSARRNLSYQRNLGAEHAKGKYLIFIDADIRIPKKSFLTQIAIEARKTHSLIYYPKVKVNKKEAAIKVTLELYNASVELSKQTKAPIPTSGMLIIDKSFFNTIGEYAVTRKHDEHILFAEDQDLLKRAKMLGVVGRTMPNVYYYMSLRRFDHTGRLRTLLKMMLAVVEQLTDQSLIQHHEMGGHLYKDKDGGQK